MQSAPTENYGQKEFKYVLCFQMCENAKMKITMCLFMTLRSTKNSGRSDGNLGRNAQDFKADWRYESRQRKSVCFGQFDWADG